MNVWLREQKNIRNFASTKTKKMKGKYMTTSLMLAVLAGGKSGVSVIVDETPALIKDHATIWSKTVSIAQEKMLAMSGRDELKTV